MTYCKTMRPQWSRRAFCAGAGACVAHPLSASSPRQHFAFAYFLNADHGRTGMRLGISSDGHNFLPTRRGKPFLVPEVGEHKLLRDPSIAQDPVTGLFHMVWTTSWFGVTIGHATSRNLIDWSKQQAIPVMQGIAGTANTWAPELVYDHAARQFVVCWASTVEGAFLETAGPDPKRDNHRIYCTKTRDFRSFSPTQLLYDPGFSVIDATFLRDKDRLYMFIKDERDNPPRKYIQWCEAASPAGPFGPLSSPITLPWSEGPSAYRVGDEVFVAFDRYTEKRYGAVASADMQNWRDISADVSFPAGASHGTIFPISYRRYNALSRLDG